MGVLAWIVFGLIAGVIAKVIHPGDDPGGSGPVGWLITMAIGILGAIVGGFIGSALGFGGVTGFNFGSFVIAVLGALLVLIIWKMIGSSGGGRRGLVHR